jgi:hypothetical protein
MAIQTKIALISQPGPEQHSIKSLLRNPLRYQVREFLSLDSVARELGTFEFEVLLMRVPVFAQNHVVMAERVRRRFPLTALITSAAQIEPGARYQARLIANHKLIYEPTELKDLPEIIDKMKKGEPSSLRLHPRTQRDGAADVVDDHGRRWQARFLDIAQMGARVVVRTRERIKRNSRVQLHFPSTSEPGRTNRVEALVVWENITGGMVNTIVNGPVQTLGLRFIASL